MIRINLLATDRGAGTKKKSAGVTTAQRIAIGAALILISTVTVVGWWFWSLRERGRKLDEEIARAEVEAQQLRSVLAQVQKFETQRAMLQQRVTLIETLRKGQSLPVHLMDEVSKSLPDRVWLISMSQRGKDFMIEARATTLTSLSDFVQNLQTSGWFKPVELVDSAVTQTPQGDLVSFSIRATVTGPDAAPPPPVAGRGAPPAK